MRVVAVIALLLLFSACCVPLSKLVDPHLRIRPSNQTYQAHRSHEVIVTREVWRDAKRDRDVPVTIYTPANLRARAPVIVFSHGIGEDHDSYAWLGRAWAGHGFIAVHVTHAGTDKATLERGYGKLYRATKKEENWIARPRDVSFVLDRLVQRDDVDSERIAVAGHSAGAFTAFALGGLHNDRGETLRDPRVKVAIAMSMPKMGTSIPNDGYDTIAIPILNVTGTCDTSVVYRTFPRDRRRPFELTHATRQYLVTIERVNHDTFSNREDAFHPLIAKITTAFLDAYLLDDAKARAWIDEGGLASSEGVAVERK